MPDPGVGFEYPRTEVSWLKRDVLLFAVSIGCTVDELHFLYELHPDFAVFPTYSIILRKRTFLSTRQNGIGNNADTLTLALILINHRVPGTAFKKTSQEVIDFYKAQESNPIPGVPKLDSRRVLDGQRKIEFLKPLPPTSEGKKFEIRSKVLGVYDKGKPGTVVETETLIVDKSSGEVYSRAVGQGFFVGQGGWGGPKGPSTPSYPPPKGREQSPDLTHTNQLNNESALLYRLNGDYNPLHATPEPGQKMGFGGAIMHGLYSWNSAAHALVKELGGSDPANIKEFQARFASPVKPGDKLVTDIWKTGKKDKDGWEEVVFTCRVDGGKICLSNGRALMKISAPTGKSKL